MGNKPSSRKRSLQKRNGWQRSAAKKSRLPVSPEQALHGHLVRLDQMEATKREFWGDYQAYLANEREKVLPEILAALWDARTKNFMLNPCARIVDAAYGSRPLCSYGSALYPGRFNIAKMASFISDFQALYVASDYPTAFLEKFHGPSEQVFGAGNIESSLMSLMPDTSFHFSRLSVRLDSVLDTRQDEALRPFCEIISRIKPSRETCEKAERIGAASPRTIQTMDELRLGLLEENYQQWATWVDQPSPSQWFGFYVRQAGIQGVIYDSVRNSTGFNLAIFPDNLKDSDARIELLDPSDTVYSANRFLDGTNYSFQVSEREASGLVH